MIEPAVHGDARAYFMETYNEKDMKEASIDIHFVQDNQSMSTKACCAVYISKSSIRSASWYALCVELCLLLILEAIPKLMANGMV